MARSPRLDADGLVAQPRDYGHIVTWLGLGFGVGIILLAMALMGQAEPVAGILLLAARLGLIALAVLSLVMTGWSLLRRRFGWAVVWLLLIPGSLWLLVLLAPLRTS